MSRHMRQLLRETHCFRRVVGFGDAVEDLGTHRICGTDAHYSRQMVYSVLYGRSGSRKVIRRIVERRPDLLELSFVAEGTKSIAREMGWIPRTVRGEVAAKQNPDGGRRSEPAARQNTEGGAR